MECYPLYSLLLATDIAHKVDLLSLDIEGAELAVLRTMPWHKVTVDRSNYQDLTLSSLR